MKKIIQRVLAPAAAVLLFGFTAGMALGEPSEAIDPIKAAGMSSEKQVDKSKEIGEQIKRATPEERKAFRERLHKEMESLSPEERQEINKKMRARWQGLTDDQKNKIKENGRTLIESMSPEERSAMHTERRELRKSIPTEEKKH